MVEKHSQQTKAFAEIPDMATELRQAQKQFVKSAQDVCMKISKGEMLFETIASFKTDLEHKKKSLKEKRNVVSELMSEIEQKEMQKEDIIHRIEKLKEEQAKRKELIGAQNKLNKNRLKNLQKARQMFEENLGLEIRVIRMESELSRGQKLQFVFRNINRSDLSSAYIVTMGISEEREYQIMSSDPPLECLPNLEKRLRETNDLAAFLVNIRKEFIALARH